MAFLFSGVTMDLESACRAIGSDCLDLLGASTEIVVGVPEGRTLLGSALVRCDWRKKATHVAWFNHHRLLEPIGYIPSAEAEANYYRQLPEQAMSV